jgi:hypothetical protein
MKKLIGICCLAVATVYGVSACLNKTRDDLYQQAAIRCAMNPDRLGCEKFNTAAGE